MTTEARLQAADLPLSRTLTLGGMRIHALEAGIQWLDGGAMFGVVPRPLWEKKIPPDSRHRIPLALRCLVVEAPNVLVLVDTGIGNKESDKFKDIYGVDNAGDPTRLEDALRFAGFQVEDVDLVVSTHLHFDHAGGNLALDPGGATIPAFPRARFVMQGGELEFARSPSERVRASYMAKNFEPLVDAGLVDVVAGPTELVEGVRLLPTPGHTPFHQSILLESQGERALFLADLCPTASHLPLPWIMGYDLEPLVTLETKRSVLGRAQEEGWVLVFQHDTKTPWGRLDPDSEKLRLLPT
ncbi:MAG: MBL fold metallo-hydrolase [Gemmatimonadetes bacterium]|nr:MBL fold metallo-hydrolase [Gemmatimonadota bacterium]NNM04823.1 MBL fold metallo-hydrolase [Gemmatimonadota bacterium]